jgi:hypothetical protein
MPNIERTARWNPDRLDYPDKGWAAVRQQRKFGESMGCVYRKSGKSSALEASAPLLRLRRPATQKKGRLITPWDEGALSFGMAPRLIH